jgi:hypothetical protein
MDNIALLAAVIIVLWLVAMGVYMYFSRQQNELADDIDELRELLDGGEDEEV